MQTKELTSIKCYDCGKINPSTYFKDIESLDIAEKGTATKLQKLLSGHREYLQNKIHKHLSKFTNDFVYFELDFAHQDKHKFLNHLLNGKMSFEYLEAVLEKLENGK